MKFTVAFLALGVTPAFSYLASLEKSNVAPAAGTTNVPYYFTSGTDTKPAAEASSGIKSYLDALTSSPAAGAPSGAGMTGYLDALPANSAGVSSGRGIGSYAETLNVAGAAAAAPAAPAAPVAPAPASFESGGNVAATSASYMEALGASSTSSISGAGMSSYLDALPRAASRTAGAGIITHVNAIPAANVAAGGAGIQSYTDALNPGSVPSKGSWAPGASSSKPAFAIGSVSGSFDFSFEADAAILQKIAAAGGRKVVLSGIVESVTYK